LRRPVTVVVGSTGRAVDTVAQRIEWMDRKQKPAALMRALDSFQLELEHSTSTDNDGFKIIVFVNNRVMHHAIFPLHSLFSICLLQAQYFCHGGC
jgi:superfamily II DNA/RNA helicase